jgi:hypothetical protein
LVENLVKIQDAEVLELVVGSGKQDNNFNITYEKFIEIDCITSSGFNPRPHDDRDDKL